MLEEILLAAVEPELLASGDRFRVGVHPVGGQAVAGGQLEELPSPTPEIDDRSGSAKVRQVAFQLRRDLPAVPALDLGEEPAAVDAGRARQYQDRRPIRVLLRGNRRFAQNTLNG